MAPAYAVPEVTDTVQTVEDVVEICNWKFKYSVAKNGVTLTDVVAEGDSALVIPSTCNIQGATKEIIAISKDFLRGRGRLASVTLPATLTDLGSTYTEPMFDVQYQGAGSACSPLPTPLPATVQGHSTWRMTVGVKMASDTLNFNKWGSAILATKPNTLDDYYNDGSMQLYVHKGHQNIIFKLDNADDRYRYSWRNIDGTTLVNDTFTFVLENDGSGGYEAKVIFANGEEQSYSITAGQRAELNDFKTLWSSMPVGMDVTVRFEQLVNGELFVDCPNLAEILVGEGSDSFSSTDGVLYNSDGSHLLRFPEGGSSWDVDGEVTKVYAGALHNVDADITFHSNPKISIVRSSDAAEEEVKARFHLVIEDAEGADFDASNLNTFQSVRYERNLAEGVYGTIMLPFVPDAESMERYAFFSLCGGDAEGLTFSEVTNVRANVPYLYALREGQTGGAITGGETTIVGLSIDTIKACCPNAVWLSVGCYKADSVVTNCVGDECTYYCIDATDNQFYLVNKKINTRPHRVYFVNTKGKCSSASAPQLSLRLRDGSTTQLTPSQLDAHSPQPIYDLLGRPVLNPSRGIYVIDGKKVVIK